MTGRQPAKARESCMRACCTDDVARHAPAVASGQYCGSCLSCSPFPGGPLPEAWEPLDWLAAFCCRSCTITAQSSNTCLTPLPAHLITLEQGHACRHGAMSAGRKCMQAEADNDLSCHKCTGLNREHTQTQMGVSQPAALRLLAYPTVQTPGNMRLSRMVHTCPSQENHPPHIYDRCWTAHAYHVLVGDAALVLLAHDGSAPHLAQLLAARHRAV